VHPTSTSKETIVFLVHRQLPTTCFFTTILPLKAESRVKVHACTTLAVGTAPWAPPYRVLRPHAKPHLSEVRKSQNNQATRTLEAARLLPLKPITSGRSSNRVLLSASHKNNEQHLDKPPMDGS